MTRRAAKAIVWSLAAPLVALELFLSGPGGPLLPPPPPIRYLQRAYWPALMAVGLVTAFQLIGSVAGRGRPLPGNGAAPALRAAVAATACWAWFMHSLPLDVAGWSWIAVAGAIVLLAELARRWDVRPGILAPLFLAWCIPELYGQIRYGWPGTFLHGPWLTSTLRGVSSLVVVAAVVIAERRLRLDRRALAAVGITPPDPVDVAFAPIAIGLLLNFTALWPDFARHFMGLYWWKWIQLPLALPTVGALVYLAGRLRRGEAPAARTV